VDIKKSIFTLHPTLNPESTASMTMAGRRSVIVIVEQLLLVQFGKSLTPISVVPGNLR